MTKRAKLTSAEKKKRAERNERRGRTAERKSDDTPRTARTDVAYGDRRRLTQARQSQDSRQRAILATVDHASKWKGTPPCDCPRCVARRALEAEAEQAVNAGRYRLKGAA